MKIALAAVALAAALVVPSALAGGTTLNGTVGPGFTITLTQNGKKVTTLKAGTYTFKIADKASHATTSTSPAPASTRRPRCPVPATRRGRSR